MNHGGFFMKQIVFAVFKYYIKESEISVLSDSSIENYCFFKKKLPMYEEKFIFSLKELGVFSNNKFIFSPSNTVIENFFKICLKEDMNIALFEKFINQKIKKEIYNLENKKILTDEQYFENILDVYKEKHQKMQ